MSELINGIIIGAIIPIITFSITQYFDYKKFKSEEKRWYGEYFLKLKVDTIKNLHSVMEECYFIYNKYLNLSPISIKEYNEYVCGKSEDYRDAKVMAEIYLDEEQNKILSHMLEVLRKADNAIKICAEQNIGVNGLTNPPFDWKEFLQAREDAVNVFKELLNPKSLREYIRNI